MISILLAAYNGEKYIEEQIESLLHQTEQDFRLYAADDGSGDGTAGILRFYAAAYPDKIKLLEFGSPSGSPQANFFRLMEAVEDDYLMFCDQDDVWIPEKIEVTLERMKEMEKKFGPEMPVLVHADLSVVDKDLNTVHASMARYQKLAPAHRELRHYLVENNITGNTVMINKALRRLCRQTPRSCCMHDWWLGMAASCFGKISYIDRPLTLYRQHDRNQLGAEDSAILEQCKKRIHAEDQVRENYRRMFAQARCFLEQYKSQLTVEQKRLLAGFLKIPEKNRIGKMVLVLRLRLVKSTLLRTLGQLWSIGRVL